MNTVDKIIDTVIRLVMGLSALILSVVTLLQVITRFVFQNPIAWGQDVLRLCFVYLIFWGGAYCVKQKEHLNIDILLTSIPVKMRKIMEILINILLVVFFIFVVYYGFIFTQSGSAQKAPYLDIPMSIYYLSLPTAGILMIYYQIKEIISQFSNFNSNNDIGGEQA